MDLEESLDLPVGMDSAGMDFRDLVESIYNDKGMFPESPPDSNSEQMLSPNSGTLGSLSPPSVSSAPTGFSLDEHISSFGETSTNSSLQLPAMPDLNAIDYSVPLQILEETNPSTKARKRNDKFEIKNETVKRKRKDSVPVFDPSKVKLEPSSSPLGQIGFQSNPQNISFTSFDERSWYKICSKNGDLIPNFNVDVSADKGFIFSTIDDAFIAQKKNHFQVTCIVDHKIKNLKNILHFVKDAEGNVFEFQSLQLNFYGVKFDLPNSFIRVEQSQSDRSKIRFDPIPVDLQDTETTFKASVGRLHFTETTANNMRKKGKPNPAQKYFQLVVALEAIVSAGTNHSKPVPLMRYASEKIIVRASNPGQFEPDSEVTWQRDLVGDSIFHMGKVAINTDQANESLTVQGNIQLTGQVFQPSDVRIKEQIHEIDSRKQLDNVNKIKIVQYKYKREFLDQLPMDQQNTLSQTTQTGVIAQEVQKILPEAVTSSGQCSLSNGRGLNDMLIVNKERLFLENVGAVRELTKVAGSLENRIGDLEKANESVSVKLSRLKRKGSVESNSTFSSTASSLNTKGRSSSRRRLDLAMPILQNKCVQMLILILISVMAISLTTMAVIYVIDFHKEDATAKSSINVFNTTEYVINEIMIDDDKQEKRPLYTNTVAAASTRRPDNWQTERGYSSRYHDLATPIVIGANHRCQNSLCQTYCCSAEDDNSFQQGNQQTSSSTLQYSTTQNLRRDTDIAENNIPNAYAEPNALFVEPFDLNTDDDMDFDQKADTLTGHEQSAASSLITRDKFEPQTTSMTDLLMKDSDKPDEGNEILEESKLILKASSSTSSPQPGSHDDNSEESNTGTTSDTIGHTDAKDSIYDYDEEDLKTQEILDEPQFFSLNTQDGEAQNRIGVSSGHKEVRYSTPNGKVDHSTIGTVKLTKDKQTAMILNAVEGNETTETNNINDTMTEEEEIKISNEVVDQDILPASGEKQRAKRDVGSYTNTLSSTESYPSTILQVMAPILRTAAENFTLDVRFCDPEGASYIECVNRGSLNVSLAIPISKYFNEESISVILPSTTLNNLNSYVICPKQSYDTIACDNHDSSSRTEQQILPGNNFNVDILDTKMLRLKIRQLMSHDVPDVTIYNICNISNTRLGELFVEYNFKFYRVCHL